MMRDEIECAESTDLAHVALDTGQARIVVGDLSDKPGTAARVFSAVAAAGVSVDLVLQNTGHAGLTAIAFTCRERDRLKAVGALAGTLAALGNGRIFIHEPIAKLSVAGLGGRMLADMSPSLFLFV